MSTLSLTFIIPTVSITSDNCPELALVKKKGIAFTVEPCDDYLSRLTLEGSIHRILEFFYVMKDVLIREVPNVTETRGGEVYQRYVLELYIPSSMVPLLIGKSGLAIENLRKIAYARIIVHDGDGVFENMNMISFEGDRLGIPQAFLITMYRIMVLQPRLGWTDSNPHRMSNITDTVVDPNTLLRSDSFSKTLVMALNPKFVSDEDVSDPTASLRKSADVDTMLSFLVPNRRVGSIIGKSGETINRIRTETNTQISISKHAKGIEERRVDVTGSLHNVYAACELVMEQLQQSTEEQ